MPRRGNAVCRTSGEGRVVCIARRLGFKEAAKAGTVSKVRAYGVEKRLWTMAPDFEEAAQTATDRRKHGSDTDS